jgi:hypothetical protein
MLSNNQSINLLPSLSKNIQKFYLLDNFMRYLAGIFGKITLQEAIKFPQQMGGVI